MIRRWVNVVGVLAMASFALATSSRSDSSRLSTGSPEGEWALSELEAKAAEHPNDARAVSRLVSAYLERGAPGAAVAVLERASAPALASTADTELAARAYVEAGRATDALRVSRAALARCASKECEASSLTRLARRVAMLDELVREGIEDPDANPVAVERLARRSMRTVRVALK